LQTIFHIPTFQLQLETSTMTTRRHFTNSFAGAAALGSLGLPFQAASQSSLDIARILVGFQAA